MSAPRIYLDRFPSFCQNYRNWWKFDEVLTKTNLLSFFWGHGVLFKPRLSVCVHVSVCLSVHAKLNKKLNYHRCLKLSRSKSAS